MSWSVWLTARMLLLLLLWLRRPLKERLTRGIEILLMRILRLAFALFVTALALLLGFG